VKAGSVSVRFESKSLPFRKICCSFAWFFQVVNIQKNANVQAVFNNKISHESAAFRKGLPQAA